MVSEGTHSLVAGNLLVASSGEGSLVIWETTDQKRSSCFPECFVITRVEKMIRLVGSDSLQVSVGSVRMADKHGELDVRGGSGGWKLHELLEEQLKRDSLIFLLRCDGLVSQTSYRDRGDRIIIGAVPALLFEVNQEGPNSFVQFNSRSLGRCRSVRRPQVWNIGCIQGTFSRSVGLTRCGCCWVTSLMKCRGRGNEMSTFEKSWMSLMRMRQRIGRLTACSAILPNVFRSFCRRQSCCHRHCTSPSPLPPVIQDAKDTIELMDSLFGRIGNEGTQIFKTNSRSLKWFS
jgi:hypothetical protein